MSELLGIARFRFHEGKREEYLRLSDQATDIVRSKDSGTLQYDLYLNDDQSECMFIERTGTPRRRSSTPRISATCSTQFLRRSQWFTANCSVNRAQSSGRSWLAATCRRSSPPTGPCEKRNGPPRFVRVLADS